MIVNDRASFVIPCGKTVCVVGESGCGKSPMNTIGNQIIEAFRWHLEGSVADPANPPSGCAFHPRCRYAQERCQQEVPMLRQAGTGQLVACHFAEALDLAGVGDSMASGV